ncbi:MAG: hypothetical protein IKG22_06485, partial [Atopobiaceae bacterium]|nr:hypothetical protein [Atopobiaceae bacterium]
MRQATTESVSRPSLGEASLEHFPQIQGRRIGELRIPSPREVDVRDDRRPKRAEFQAGANACG